MLYVYEVIGDMVTVVDTDDWTKESITAGRLLQIVSLGVQVAGIERGQIIPQDTYYIGNTGYKINREGLMIYANSAPVGKDIVSLTRGLAPNFTFLEDYYGDNKVVIPVDDKISDAVVQTIIQFPNTQLTKTNKGYLALQIYPNANPQHINAIYTSPYFLETYTVYEDCDKVRMCNAVACKVLNSGFSFNSLRLLRETGCRYFLNIRTPMMDKFSLYLQENVISDFKLKYKVGAVYECRSLANCVESIVITDGSDTALADFIRVLPNLGLPKEIVHFFSVYPKIITSNSPYKGVFDDAFRTIYAKSVSAYDAIQKKSRTVSIDEMRDIYI